MDVTVSVYVFLVISRENETTDHLDAGVLFPALYYNVYVLPQYTSDYNSH